MAEKSDKCQHAKVRCEFLYYVLNLQKLFQMSCALFNQKQRLLLTHTSISKHEYLPTTDR